MLLSKRHEGRDEVILDPDMPIIDSHIHLWDFPDNRYLFEDYLQDAQGGHKVLASIYCESQRFVRSEGPDMMKPIGEVEFANGMAAMTATGHYGQCRVAAGIIGHANLTYGAPIGELLDRCMAAAPDRYRGVRHVTLDYPDERPFKYIFTYRPPAGILDHPEFGNGLAELDKRGLIYDAAIYDPSLPRLAEVVDQHPNLTVVLNHMGNVVRVDMSEAEKAATFTRWSAQLRELAKRPNVMCKVGGLGMPICGFGFEDRADAVGYEELAEAWRPFIETAVEAFGTERCIFGSNFPPDGRSAGYIPTLNAYKHVLRDFSADERRDIFARNAARVYRLDIAGH